MHNALIIRLPLIGELEITVSDRKLMEMAQDQLKPYIIEKRNKPSELAGIYASEISLRNSEILKKLKTLEESFVFSRDIRYTPVNGLKVDRKHTFSSFSQKTFIRDGHVTVSSAKNQPAPVRIIKTWLGNGGFIHQLFYELVLFPIFNLYSLFDHYYVMHGTLAEIAGNAVIITGLDGVGKSSLAESLVKSGIEVYADNFVLYNGNTALGLTMPIRRDGTAETGDLGSGDMATAKPVRAIMFVAIADRLSLAEIHGGSAQIYMNLINAGAAEINDANRHAIPFHLLNMFQDRIAESGSVPRYYLLNIPKGQIQAGKEMLIRECSLSGTGRIGAQ
jgi:hypothetical protein